MMKQHTRIGLGPSWLRKAVYLYRQMDQASTWIANILLVVLGNSTTAEEKMWIKKIEAMRAELNASNTPITGIEYGDGALPPGATLSSSQIERGEVNTTTIGKLCQTCSSPYFWSFLLFKCVRKFKPSVCLELGTCLGISTSYLAAALKLNTAGRVVTLEGDEVKAKLAAQNFKCLGLDNTHTIVGRFQDTLSGVLEHYRPIQFAFIDGHHDEKATVAYFEQIFPALSQRSLLVFDDISWSPGMRRAWNIIEADDKVALSVDLNRLGICVIDSAVKKKITC